MAIDYREVLRELRFEEDRLQKELDIVRDALPAIESMAAKMPPVSRDWLKSESHPYQTMGTKAAIGALLLSHAGPMMPAEIAKDLKAGGIQTKSEDFIGTVTSTLNQMKSDNLVMRTDDGWVLVRKGVMTRPPTRDASPNSSEPETLSLQ